jgi:hypothetical protein
MRGRLADLALAALALVQLAGAMWLVPTRDAVAWRDGSPLGGACWFHAATGLDCPFCGMTRSFVALAHGQVAAAFRFHPAGPLLFVAMLAFLAAVAIAAARRARPIFERRGFVAAFQAVAVVCLATGVIHMVRS